MATATKPSEAMIEALEANEPFPAYADELMLFGQLVGSWDVEVSFFDPEGNVIRERRGEWHFGWVLEGRVIQDVLISPPRERAPDDSAGQTRSHTRSAPPARSDNGLSPVVTHARPNRSDRPPRAPGRTT